MQHAECILDNVAIFDSCQNEESDEWQRRQLLHQNPDLTLYTQWFGTGFLKNLY